MSEDITILLTAEEIETRLRNLAGEIDSFYENADIDEFVAICILKGSYIFAADLLRLLKTKNKVDFLQVASYEGTLTTGKIEFQNDLEMDIAGKHILIIEDIIDTGNTLSKVIEKLWQREPAGIQLCSFLDKPTRRTVKMQGDFIGFTIPDHFVVGYGLDYNQCHRSLPYLGILNVTASKK